MKKVILSMLVLIALIGSQSCYKNYYDVTDENLETINSVSFRNDVVPIMISGACGCHNNNSTRQVPFSAWENRYQITYKPNGNDTITTREYVIYYSAIQTRAEALNDMALGGPHPGEGSIFFTPSQADIVKKWYDQGAKDDYIPPAITVEVSYKQHIVPIYKTDCAGGTCHGGAAVTLDYNAMVAEQETITTMMKSSGKQGHPGGPLSISTSTSAYFLAWYAGGMKP
jgi:hypothetical protein